MHPHLTFRSRGHHTTRKRGVDCTYGRSEGGALQKHISSLKFDENVGQIEGCNFC